MGKQLKRFFVYVLPLVAIGIGGAWFLGAGAGHTPSIAYDTVPIDRGSIRRTVSTAGPVRALVMVSVGTQISGLISRLEVDYNSEVKAGQLLALFDNKTHVAGVSQARAELAMARAGLVLQQAALDKAQAVLVEAERRTLRMQTLAAKGVAATKLVDDATRDTQVAKAEIAVVKAQIENAAANVAVRESALDQALITLERTEIRSPIDGTVIMRVVDAGQTVTANMSTPELFKIAQDLRRIRIEAQVNEADVGSVTAGNPVTFSVDALPMRRFAGRVTQVRLAASESQGVVTYTAIIEADNEDRRLYPGMTANVLIETAHRSDVLRVPNDALRFRFRKGGAAGSAQAAQAAARTPSAAGAEQRAAALAAELKSAVGLDEAQIAAVIARLNAEAAGANGELDGMRLERAVAAVATPAQRERVEAWKRSRDFMRDATVYVVGADGTPEARQIRIATADEHYAEIVSGALSAGDRVIVRAREAR